MDYIVKAEHAYFVPGDHSLKPAEFALVLHWRDRETGFPKFTGQNLPVGVERKVTTDAYISHSRWVADCPGPNCWSAQYVSPDDPRFFCIHCENEYVNGKWIIVVWPKNWQAREKVLLERPDVRNRNALPHESLADLRRENKERMGV